jgi:hypothetical protein
MSARSSFWCERGPENGRSVEGLVNLIGIGFTMSLFIAILAFAEEHILNIATTAILGGSLVSGCIGSFMLRLAATHRLSLTRRNTEEIVMPDQINAMLESLRTLWNQLIQFLPQLVVGIIIMIVGWICAKLLRKGVVFVLKLLRIDKVAEKAGIEDFLLKGGAQYSTVNVLANLFYWFLVFALTLAILHSLGLDAAKELFNRILLYIPNVVAAVLVLIFGTLLAKLVRGATFTYLTNVRIAGSEFISTVTYWAIVFLVVSVALQQLSLGGQLLISAFEIAFGGLCLALAIAFGLAGKEWATQILEKLWRSSR